MGDKSDKGQICADFVPAPKKAQSQSWVLEKIWSYIWVDRPPFIMSHTEFLALVFLLAMRVAGALFSVLNDCDEVYNYWEPVNYLVRGFGMQTWEYSPEFALRTYIFVYLLAAPGKLLSWFITDGVTLFYALRLLLALFGFSCEACMAYSVRRTFGPLVGLYFVVFLAVSSGPFAASVALLPSSFFMNCSMLVWALNMRAWQRSAVFMAIVATLVGWPFAAVTFIPFCLQFFMYRGLVQTLVTGVVFGILVLVPVVLLDHELYGKWTVTPLNIFLYNTGFGGGGGGAGSSVLYGVEPWYYYLKVLVLNFNALTILVAGAGIAVHYLAQGSTMAGVPLVPVPLWVVLLSALPHKEERFMYVIYPGLCLLAAITSYRFHMEYGWPHPRYDTRGHPKPLRKGSMPKTFFLLLLAVPVLGFARIAAVSVHFAAPMTVWGEIRSEIPSSPCAGNCTICVGKEWYRYPSSFFLPEGSHLAFVRAGFTGILPAAFGPSTSSPPAPMNSMNREEPSRYVDPASCDFAVDTWEDAAPESWWPHQAIGAPVFAVKPLRCEPMLDLARSRSPWRSFWIPGVTSATGIMRNKLNFVQMCLVQIPGPR